MKPSWLSCSGVQEGTACCWLNVLSNLYLSFEENELEQLGRSESAHSALDEEWSPDLDYALALSLQNEDHQHKNTAAEIPSDFWETCYTKESVSSACRNERDELDTFCDSFMPSSMPNLGKSKCKHHCFLKV